MNLGTLFYASFFLHLDYTSWHSHTPSFVKAKKCFICFL